MASLWQPEIIGVAANDDDNDHNEHNDDGDEAMLSGNT